MMVSMLALCNVGILALMLLLSFTDAWVKSQGESSASSSIVSLSSLQDETGHATIAAGSSRPFPRPDVSRLQRRLDRNLIDSKAVTQQHPFIGMDEEGQIHKEPAEGPPSGCKYNLDDFVQYNMNSNSSYWFVKYARSEQLQGGYPNSPNGPKRFKRNRLPDAFKPKCDYVKRPYVMAMTTRAMKDEKRVIAGCIAHGGSNQIEYPTVSVYDCNGKQLACGYTAVDLVVKSTQDVLILITPDSHRKPEGFMFVMQKRRLSSDWCDYYPF